MKNFTPIVAVLIGLLIISSCSSDSDEEPDNLIIVGQQYSDIAIAADDVKQYQFVATGAGAHTISLTGLGSDLDWYLYSDPQYTDEIDSQDDFSDTSDEIGTTVDLIAGDTYYLEIKEWDEVDSQFDLKITFP